MYINFFLWGPNTDRVESRRSKDISVSASFSLLFPQILEIFLSHFEITWLNEDRALYFLIWILLTRTALSSFDEKRPQDCFTSSPLAWARRLLSHWPLCIYPALIYIYIHLVFSKPTFIKIWTFQIIVIIINIIEFHVNNIIILDVMNAKRKPAMNLHCLGRTTHFFLFFSLFALLGQWMKNYDVAQCYVSFSLSFSLSLSVLFHNSVYI